MSQSGHNDLAYVAGEEYKVINTANGFSVEWQGEPAGAEQLETVSEREVRVLNPQGKERLIIYLWPDGRFSDVIDLKYTDPDTYFARRARDREYAKRDAARRIRDKAYEARNQKYHERDAARVKARQQRVENFDWSAYREFTFGNGLIITVTDGEASATYQGESLEVTGSDGRYRVMSETFEAGVAFGPNYRVGGYKYLKKL
ncbi:MAG: hypothetical protein AAFY76_11335 [Cyanobacteria bacterium J06649_11]